MGFLDELKKQQSAEGNSQPDREVYRPSAEVATHVRAMLPRLTMLRDNLEAFSQRLRAAMPDIRTSYAVRHFGMLTDLRQSGYRFAASKDWKLEFGLMCRGDTGLDFTVTSRDACDEMLDFLIEAGLKVHYRSHADWKFLFSVKPEVPVTIGFEPLDTAPALRLTLTNLDEIGIRVERIDPRQIDEEFVESLKKSVLREPNRFTGLLGNEVTSDVREQLRARIEQRQREREAQLRHDEAESTQPGAIGRLKGLLGRRGPK